MTLRVGIGAAPFRPEAVEFVRQAERLGVDSVWCPEFWAGDAFTPLAYLAACTSTVKLGSGIAQLGARTPAMLAMTAQSLHALSGGRCLLGIGTSGPQVMEGWHGVSFDKPVRRTRETIEIIRAITAGERLDYHGQIYELPLPGSEGRAIRSLMSPTHLPIYLASLGPANLRLTGEIADGWIGTSFFPETAEVFLDPIREGACDCRTGARRPRPHRRRGDRVHRRRRGRRPPPRRRATRSPSAPWARPARTSTTTRSSDRATATTSARSNDSGSRATRTPPVDESLPRSGSAPTSSAPTTSCATACACTATPGSPPSRANLHGGTDVDLDRQLGDLERLLDLVRQVNDETTAADIG